MPAYFDENKKTWYVKFRYTDWTGTPRFTTKRGFATKREAKAYELDTKRESTSAPTLTLKMLWEKYKADMKTRVKPSTYRTKTSYVRKHILPVLGDLPICDIKPVTVRKWQSTLQGNTYTQCTLKTVSTMLSSLFNYAVKFYGLQSNPVQIAGSIGKITTSSGFWTPDEFNTFIKCVDRRAAEIAFRVLFCTGMRSGELFALTPNDISGETISISKTYDHIDKTSTAPKTATSNRVITVPIQIIDLLNELIAAYDEPPKRIFECLSRLMLSRDFENGIKKSGVPKIRVHDLRHSHASFLIQKNVPITAIARRLGHKDASVTLSVYSHFYHDNDKQIADIVGQMLVS